MQNTSGKDPDTGKLQGVNRREFLRGSAATMAGAAALTQLLAASGCSTSDATVARADGGTAEPKAAAAGESRPGANGKVVVGVIGTGDLGRRHHLSNMLLPNPRIEVAAVCDVDANHRNDAARICLERTGKRVGVYEDFRHLLDRKDIDAVLIATPDHWHALIAIAACEAGKDIYCEKPLTWCIEEGRQLVKAARRYGTVFQTGSQQRSDARFRQACELVRNGKIGKIIRIDTVLHSVRDGTWQAPTTPPPNLNWDFWLGPAPYQEYWPAKVHYEFRWFYDFSGGVMTDWGAHHNDIAQWALGMDGSGPVEVDGRDVKGPHTVPKDFNVHYKYANGVTLTCHSTGFTDEHGKFGNGVKFTGTDGWIFVSRAEIKASNPDILKIELGPDDVRLYKSDHHHNNWLDCIASRERPICDVEIGHRSVSVCHLGNISMKLGRPLKWDPEREEFIDDPVANQMRSRAMRAPWHL
jgi:predicted dehydrogenase